MCSFKEIWFFRILIILKSDKEVVISGLLDVDALDLIQVEANFIFAEDLMCSPPPQLHQLPGTYFLCTLLPSSFLLGKQESPTGKIDAVDLIPKPTVLTECRVD